MFCQIFNDSSYCLHFLRLRQRISGKGQRNKRESQHLYTVERVFLRIRTSSTWHVSDTFHFLWSVRFVLTEHNNIFRTVNKIISHMASIFVLSFEQPNKYRHVIRMFIQNKIPAQTPKRSILWKGHEWTYPYLKTQQIIYIL